MVERGQRCLGDTEAARELGERHTVDVDGECVLLAHLRGLEAIGHIPIADLGRAHDALRGEDLVDDVLTYAEVLTCGKARVEQRLDRSGEAAEHLACSRVIGVAVDSALGTAEGHVAISVHPQHGVLERHAACEVAHLIEGHALAHPESAAGDATRESIDDDVAVDAGLVVGPGDLEVGRAHDASSRRSSGTTITVGPERDRAARISAVRSAGSVTWVA